MEKICKICGKSRFMFSWEDICDSCRRRRDLEEIQRQIRNDEEEVDTFSSDYVVCPYCGHAMDTYYGYEDFPEIYEEGEHEIECGECERTFILETMVSYSYETRRTNENTNICDP